MSSKLGVKMHSCIHTSFLILWFLLEGHSSSDTGSKHWTQSLYLLVSKDVSE